MPPLFWIDGDAGLLEAEIGDVGVPADREHHLFGGNAGSVRQMRGEFVAVLVHFINGAAGENGDALFLHLGAHMLADVLVEAAQDIVAAIDHGDVGAVAGENAGEFQRDVTAALDHDALRQFSEMKRLVGGNDVLDAGNLPPVVGRAAGRDQDVFRGDLLAGHQAQRVGVFQHRTGFHNARATLLDIGGVDAFEPRDLLVLVGDKRRPVEGDVRNGPAEAGRVLDLVFDVRAEHEQFFRHAAADHAGAAHPVFFGDHHPGAVAGCDAGGANAARTTADDEEIDVELSHINPARSQIDSCFLFLRTPVRYPCRASSSRPGTRR